MGWFSNLISGGADKVIDSVTDGLDRLFTSDDERLKAKLLIEKELNIYKIQLLQAQSQYDQEITKRWQSDNEHAVTRLVRPLSFAFVLALFAIVILFDGNLGTFSINPAYIPVIEGLLYTMVIAYFGSRGAEKITRTIKPKPKENKTPLMQNFDNEF